MVAWLILWMNVWERQSGCIIILCLINIQVGRIGWLTLWPCCQQTTGAVGVFTGNTACSRGGGRNGFIFTPACFITSEAFLNRLTKGKAAEADGSFCRPPALVPPDRGNHTTACHWSFWPNLIFKFLFLLLSYFLVVPPWWLMLFVCLQVNSYLYYWDIQINLPTQKFWKWP